MAGYLYFSQEWETAIPNFWIREGGLRGLGSADYQTLNSLCDRLMQNARSLRQQWLTPKATDVVEKMQWAEQHLPPAWLFARTEYAVSQLIQSNGDLHRSAFGRGQVSDAEVKRHLESIKELDSIIQLSHGIIDAGLL